MRLPVTGVYSLYATVNGLGNAPADPTFRCRGRELVMATRTPEGPAALRVVHTGDELLAEAYGDGGAWLIERAGDLCGLHDDPLAFVPADPRLAELVRRNQATRMSRGANPLEIAIRSVFGQRVTAEEARRFYAMFVHRYGEPAPGPFGLKLPPSPAAIRRLAAVDLHRLALDRGSATALRALAVEADRIDAQRDDMARTIARMGALPQIGPWTLALVRRHAYGDASAALVGDWHVARDVVFALTGEERGDDARMLELLAPYAGNEARVIEALALTGVHHPRRAPGRGLGVLAANL